MATGYVHTAHRKGWSITCLSMSVRLEIMMLMPPSSSPVLTPADHKDTHPIQLAKFEAKPFSDPNAYITLLLC